MLSIVAVLVAVSCDGDNYYGYSEGCLPISECPSKGIYPYALGRVCIPYVPKTSTGLFRNAKGAYQCPSGKITVFNNSEVRCEDSFAECRGLFVGKSVNACAATAMQCYDYLRLVVYENGDERLCASGEELRALGAIF